METEAIRLERSVNLFTAQFEHERKDGLLLTEQIRACEDELRRRISIIRHVTTSNNPEEKKLRFQITALERQIHLLDADTAEMMTYNRGLKEQINGWRLERRNQNVAIEMMKLDLSSVKEQKEERSSERVKLTDADATQRQQINSLRSKSAHQQFRQHVRITELEDTFKTQMLRALETLDPSPVQSALSRKWKDVTPPQKVSTAQRDTEDYLHRIHTIEEAFERIRAIMGFEDNTEVVTAVRKTEEQIGGLYTQVSKLGGEIDELDEDVCGVRRMVERKRGEDALGQTRAASLLSSLRSQLSSVHTRLLSTQSHLSLVQSSISSIPPFLQESSQLLSLPGFPQLSPLLSQGDSLLSRLSMVDSGIFSLLTWLSYISNGKVTFAAIPPKRFDATVTSFKGLATTIIDTEEIDEGRGPLREAEFRIRVKGLLEKRRFTDRKGVSVTPRN